MVEVTNNQKGETEMEKMHAGEHEEEEMVEGTETGGTNEGISVCI